MGCGASQAVNPVESITQAPEPTQRAENDGHGHKAWERAVFAANAQWTAHSTSAVAKHAMAQGLPEPPESFFTTQERLVSFFYSEGAQQTFAPNEVGGWAGTGGRGGCAGGRAARGERGTGYGRAGTKAA
jgi:hypothetical protein